MQLLSRINCPVKISKSTTEAMITDIVANQYAALGVECVIFDETQRLKNRSNTLELEQVANALVSIMNLVKGSFIFAGTPEIDQLRKAFGPLARRVQDVIKIQPFDLRSQDGAREFTRLIAAINACLPLKLPSWLLSREGLEFVGTETGGILGVLIRLIEHAAIQAFDSGENSISSKQLLNAADVLETAKWPQVCQVKSELINVDSVLGARARR
jgi:hypothetical protein